MAKILKFESLDRAVIRQEMIEAISEADDKMIGCLLIYLEKDTDSTYSARINMTELEAISVLEDIKSKFLMERRESESI